MARTNPFSGGPNGRSWYHRGFLCLLKQRERRIRCRYRLARCNLWIPREFYWENTSRSDCNHYIDLLCAKKLIDAKVFEDQKVAVDFTYERGSDEDRPHVTITAQRLIAMLRGEEILEVPMDARIRFVPTHRRHTCNDVDAEILGKELTEEYFRALQRTVGAHGPIICVNMPDEKEIIEKFGFRLSDEYMHTGCNLAIARGAPSRDEPEPAPVAPPVPVSETSVSEVDHKRYTETVSLITGNEQVPYFVKRLIRDQHLLWCGTSYDAKGPWAEYTRDQSRLTALGIVIS